MGLNRLVKTTKILIHPFLRRDWFHPYLAGVEQQTEQHQQQHGAHHISLHMEDPPHGHHPPQHLHLDTGWGCIGKARLTQSQESEKLTGFGFAGYEML